MPLNWDWLVLNTLKHSLCPNMGFSNILSPSVSCFIFFMRVWARSLNCHEIQFIHLYISGTCFCCSRANPRHCRNLRIGSCLVLATALPVLQKQPLGYMLPWSLGVMALWNLEQESPLLSVMSGKQMASTWMPGPCICPQKEFKNETPYTYKQMD